MRRLSIKRTRTPAQHHGDATFLNSPDCDDTNAAKGNSVVARLSHLVVVRATRHLPSNMFVIYTWSYPTCDRSDEVTRLYVPRPSLGKHRTHYAVSLLLDTRGAASFSWGKKYL